MGTPCGALLIVFTRYPDPGKVKTRLIPALGKEGSAALHWEMTLHTLKTANRLIHRRSVSLEVHGHGADTYLMGKVFGDDLCYRRQCPGDLGERMLSSFLQSFYGKMDKVIIIGTDCPGISVELLEQAFIQLDMYDLILGPANDGGYYLIGMKKVIPALFEDIPWGTGDVLKRTITKAEKMALSLRLLKPLGDVDGPEDLYLWHTTEKKINKRISSLSVIIPTINEAKTIPGVIECIHTASEAEIIVVDGGSTDDTVQLANAGGAKVITSSPGRAGQMNKGANAAQGDILLFLHADTFLPHGFDNHIRLTFQNPHIVAGAFSLHINGDSPSLRILELMVNFRSRYLQMPYGDQGIFIRAAFFRLIGGFPDLPIMEDFAFMKLIHAYGRVVTLKAPACTSPRRWDSLGIIRTTIINLAIIFGYLAGINPQRLSRWYHMNCEHL